MTDRVFGHIPGVAVGTVFPDRRSLSQSGVHRPTQAGISGNKTDGAVSDLDTVWPDEFDPVAAGVIFE